MMKIQNLDDAIEQEIEKALPAKPSNDQKELDKAIAETKLKINEAFRHQGKASVKLTLSA
jgi:hypothetical protein